MWISKDNINIILNAVLMKLYYTNEIKIFYSNRWGELNLLIDLTFTGEWGCIVAVMSFKLFLLFKHKLI